MDEMTRIIRRKTDLLICPIMLSSAAELDPKTAGSVEPQSETIVCDWLDSESPGPHSTGFTSCSGRPFRNLQSPLR
jgi:hypothetical protein